MYGPELEIGTPVFMDDIMAIREAEDTRTGTTGECTNQLKEYC